MIREMLVGIVACAFASGACGYEWLNVSQETRIGGRMVSPGYLRGKVVLFDCRDYADPANAEVLKRLQSIWATYKTKPFVVLGSHRGEAGTAKVREMMDKLGITYPVYRGARLSNGELENTDGKALVYVIDSTCSRRLYGGKDDRAATGVVGSAIFAARMPTNAKQWKFQLDYELENLPGQAYLRLKALKEHQDVWSEMQSKYPEDAKRYEDTRAKFSENNEIKKLAKLVELARLVKDRDTESEQAKKIKPEHLERVEEKYESLKGSDNPYIVQETKNALVDIRFAKASLKTK